MTEAEIGWGSVLNEARRLADESGQAFEPAVFENLADLVAFGSAGHAAPSVSLGYWPTIQLSWAELSLEIFDDRIECYPTSPPGAVVVWYEPHRAGAPFSRAFAEGMGVAAAL